MARTGEEFAGTGLCGVGVLCLAALCSAATREGGTLQDDPPIRVDQAGYLPALPKVAIVVQPASDHPATSFALHRSKDKSVVMTGQLSAPVIDEAPGDAVQYAEFTKVKEGADYYLEVPGLGKSWNFAIRPDVYNRVYYLAMRAFYGQRCGTAVDLSPDFLNTSMESATPTGATILLRARAVRTFRPRAGTMPVVRMPR